MLRPLPAGAAAMPAPRTLLGRVDNSSGGGSRFYAVSSSGRVESLTERLSVQQRPPPAWSPQSVPFPPPSRASHIRSHRRSKLLRTGTTPRHAMPASLVLTAAPVASLQQLSSLLQAHGLSPLDPVAVATSSGALAAGALSAGAYELVLSVAAQPGHHTVQLLGLLAAAIRPGGKLVVQEVGGRAGCGAAGGAWRHRNNCGLSGLHTQFTQPFALSPCLVQPGTAEEALKKALLLSGFSSTAPAPGGGLAAHKPAWETGAKAAIALKPRQQAANSGSKLAAAAATWVLGGDDVDEELVDDDELLTEEDKQRPAPPGAALWVGQGGRMLWGTGHSVSVQAGACACHLNGQCPAQQAHASRSAAGLLMRHAPFPSLPGASLPAAAARDDCEVGAAGRKACKDCTCGRAEGEAAPQVQLTKEMLDNPTSGGCGSVSTCGAGTAGGALCVVQPPSACQPCLQAQILAVQSKINCV